MDKIQLGLSNLRQNLRNNIEIYKKGILVVIIVFALIFLSFFISEEYRVKTAIDRIDIYKDYMSLDSSRDNQELRLCDFYIASSFRPLTAINQRFDYCSTRILERVLKYGARFLWLDVFTDGIGKSPSPIVCVGQTKGSWNYSLNNVLLEDCIYTIASTAFTSGKVNNHEDPIIIALNLNVDRNFMCLKKIKDILVRHLGSKLLGIHYSRSSQNIGQVAMKKLMGKVIIFSGDGYEDSELEELINYSWTKKELKVINNKSVDPNVKISNYVKEDGDALINYNKNNLSIVVPEQNSFFTRQYNPTYSWDLGCQFVSMHYQNIDGFMDFYITKFRRHSFLPKPVKLRGESTSYKRELVLQPTLSKADQNDKVLANCAIEPKVSMPRMDIGDQPNFKNEQDDVGVCFIADKCNGPYEKVTKSVDWIVNEVDKDSIGFGYTNENTSAGIDTSGNAYYNNKPTLCCAKKNKLPIKNKYVLAPFCDNPLNTAATVGLKVRNEDVAKVPFNIGNSDGDKHKWVHPKLCKIDNVNELKEQQFCLLSPNNCPEGWSNNAIKAENNWNICCKNTQ
jgi:hypothetical protein